jgi:hypothetical protein
MRKKTRSIKKRNVPVKGLVSNTFRYNLLPIKSTEAVEWTFASKVDEG